MGPRAGLEERGKFRPHRDSIHGSSSPWRVVIPTELSRSMLTELNPVDIKKIAFDLAFNAQWLNCYVR